MARFLNEDFNSSDPDARLQWLNEPGFWKIEASASVLAIEPDANTDFWRKTHYGFEADNGHLFGATVHGDFAMVTKVRFLPVHQYDQAGLMVRADADCWIKASVEYEIDESPKLGAVVTNAGYSDWSVQEFDRERQDVWLRVSREGSDFIVEYSGNGERWQVLRVAHLHVSSNAAVRCGVYACSPKGAGFRAEFDLLRIDV